MDKFSNLECVLCEGNHSANYKGYSTYRELIKNKYPTFRPKVQIAPQANHVQPRTGQLPNQLENNAPLTQNISTPSNVRAELKTILKTLTGRMGTMLNLLTTVITKLTK